MGITIPLPTKELSAVYINYEPSTAFNIVDMFCRVMDENTAVFIQPGDSILGESIYKANVKSTFDSELLFYNQKNLNNRIYTKESIRNLSRLKEKAEQKTLLGELGHPSRMDVSLSNVSHVIEKIWEDDDKLMGRIHVLETPQGKVLQNMIDSGCEMIFSSRASGTIENGICKNVNVFSFDAIPASEDSFMNIRNISKQSKNIL